MIGQSVGHYIISEKLGEGGMGVVYKARDTRLDRFVAIKTLPSEKLADQERKKRFVQEAKSASALNHPHIITVHDINSDQGLDFIVMEFVQGKTLDELIPRKGMRLVDLLKYGVQMADALSAAHDAGIVHRDLKPSNIMVNDQGRLKVLDFGLVKLKEQTAPSGSAAMDTLSVRTDEGKIVGTVAYMSPEQAEGKPVDHRSDIFSLGIILYEMATGTRPFGGDTNMSVLSSIVKDTPKSAREMNPSVPTELSRIIRRCLNKDLEHRYQSAKDLRNDLEELKQDLDSGELAARPAERLKARPRRLLVFAAVFIAVVVLGGLIWLLRNKPKAPREYVGPINASFTQITFQKGLELFPSISPDGKWIAYQSDTSGNSDIYLQSVSEQNAINLTKDSAVSDSQPAFSPDGQSIAFRSEREGGGIFVMGITGGNVRRISDSGYNPSWSPTGKEIVYATVSTSLNPYDRGGISELWIVNVDSGQKRRIFEGDAMQPQWSPNGKRIAFWGLDRERRARRDIWTVSLAGSQPVPVTSDDALDWSPAWSPDGKYLYFASDRGGALNLWRVRIDEETGRLQGPPQPLTTPSNWAGHLSFSLDGRRLVYFSFTGTRNIQRFAFDPTTATVKDAGTWVTARSQFAGTTYLDLSPDGESLVYNTGQTQEDIFICRVDGSGLRALTNDKAIDRGPRWSPDGRQIAFYSNRSGTYETWIINRDGSGLKQLSERGKFLFEGPIWSPDGNRMGGVDFQARVTMLIDLRKPWKDQAPEVLPPMPEPGEYFIARSWSADGSRLAGDTGSGVATYSLETKSYEILTRDGGSPSNWLNDSRRLLYLWQGKLMLIDRQSKKIQEVLSVQPDTIGRSVISPDGKYLYVVRNSYESDIGMVTFK